MKELTVSDGGIVMITAGKHKGKTGFWDDDESLPGGVEGAIVYLGVPFQSQHVTVKYTSLRLASKAEKAAYNKLHGTQYL